ncbi:MAG: hypothetical protein EHM59_22000, partial [Betaproteobacteria bacterium]
MFSQRQTRVSRPRARLRPAQRHRHRRRPQVLQERQPRIVIVDAFTATVSAVCLGIGSFFVIVGCLGLIRMPDRYTRM